MFVNRPIATGISIACGLLFAACESNPQADESATARIDPLVTTPGAVAPAAGSGAAGAPATAGSISGSATFTIPGSGNIRMLVSITGCTTGKQYPIHIHEGGSCENAMTQGGHWDIPRGEAIPNVSCVNGVGTLTYTRTNADAKTAWSIHNPANNLVGHTVVLHDPDDGTVRVACGVITR